MGTAGAEDWAAIGLANLRDAQGLFMQASWRSCISRAYYSSMASAHAILLRMDQLPPDFGNWPNPKLPAALSAALGRGQGKDARARTIALKHRGELANCWSYRLQADYSPAARMTDAMARQACECARNLYARWETLR